MGHGQVWVSQKDTDPPLKSYDEVHEESLLQLERLCDWLMRHYPETKGMDVDAAVIHVVGRLELNLETERERRQTEAGILQRQEADESVRKTATTLATDIPIKQPGEKKGHDVRIRILEKHVADLFRRTSAAPPPKGNGTRPELDPEALERVESESAAAVKALFNQIKPLIPGDDTAIKKRLAEFERLAKEQGEP